MRSSTSTLPVRHVPPRHLPNSRGSSMKPTAIDAIFAIPSQFAVIEVDSCGHVNSSELSRCAEALCVYSKANSSTNVLQQQSTVQTTSSSHISKGCCCQPVGCLPTQCPQMLISKITSQCCNLDIALEFLPVLQCHSLLLLLVVNHFPESCSFFF